MDDKINELISRMNKHILNEDFIEIAEEVAEEFEKMANASAAIEPILKLMENNSEVDYGKPGPLVHFLERFYGKGYEEKLVDSLERRPTKHTVWMLNRIINGSEEEKKKYFLSILDKIITFSNLEQDVIELAQHFKALHV